MKWGAQQGLGVVASRWLGGGKAKARGREIGWGAISCHLRHVLFRICLDEKGCWRTSILFTHIHEFLYTSHFFNLFILLSYLIFDLYAWRYHWPTHMELPNMHVHTYTHTKKNQKKGGGERRCNDNEQITVTHLGEPKRLRLESSKQNDYIISLWVIIKAIFIPNIHMLLKNSVAYINVTSTYLRCIQKNSI